MKSSNTTNGYEVYIGLWTNWSKQAPMRQTLTLTKGDGELLIAFLAFYVAFIGTRFWRLSCLALHRTFSTKAHPDGLYHQRQALLRNGPNAESGFVTLAQLAWTWRRLANRVWIRILPLLGFSLLCFAFWSVGAGFSPRLYSLQDNQVLLSGKNCAILWENKPTNVIDDWSTLFPAINKYIQQAAIYAQTCYENNSPSALGCDIFVQKGLRYSIETNTSCPFSADICYLDQAIRLDSGLLDSNNDFGLNAKPEKRWQYRQTIQCSPIKTQGYSQSWNYSADRSYTRYFYGPAVSLPDQKFNFTRQFSNDAIFEEYNIVNNIQPDYDYSIEVAAATLVNGSVFDNSFTPISALTGQSANFDLDIFFLQPNGVVFANRSEDPWYRATVPVDFQGWMKYEGGEKYTFPEPASALACVSQYQYCIPMQLGGNLCTDLSGYADTMYRVSTLLGLGTNSTIGDVLNTRFWDSLGSLGFGWPVADVVGSIGATALLGRQGLSSSIQGLLPPNQWQLEVQHWFTTSLATLQASTVAKANGPESGFAKWLIRPNTTDQYNSCQNQKILSAEFYSFSFFWLLFILIMGLVIIIISFTIDPCLRCGRRKWDWQNYQQLEWTTNEVFQLQRLAHEELGLGTWSRTDGFIPVTLRGEQLGILDLSDTTHLGLVAKPKLESASTSDLREGLEIGEDNQQSWGLAAGATLEGGSFPLEGVETAEHDGHEEATNMAEKHGYGSTENSCIDDTIKIGKRDSFGSQLIQMLNTVGQKREKDEYYG